MTWSQRQQQPQAAAAAEQAAHGGPAPQQLPDNAAAISVQQSSLQHLQVSAAAHLPLSPETVFSLITHPRNEQIFRHLEACAHHRVVSDDGAGRVTVESEHVATWRVAALSGRLRTRLRVEQDWRELHSSFALVPGRFNLLKSFGGRWAMAPAPAERCSAMQQGGDGASGKVACSLLTLTQAMQPAVPLPPPLGGLLRQLACNQLHGIFDDLQAEAQRINSGRPTLWQQKQGGA